MIFYSFFITFTLTIINSANLIYLMMVEKMLNSVVQVHNVDVNANNFDFQFLILKNKENIKCRGKTKKYAHVSYILSSWLITFEIEKWSKWKRSVIKWSTKRNKHSFRLLGQLTFFSILLLSASSVNTCTW